MLFYYSYREPKIVYSGGQSQWPPFSEEKNSFVTITSTPSPHENFRFCQMALWGGIFPRLQSATCEALWGITKFSEDALAAVDYELRQGMGSSAVVSTVVNSTLSGNVVKGAVINEVLNKTLPADHGSQVGNGALIHAFLNKTLPPQSDSKVGNLTVTNTILNKTALGKSGASVAWLNATVPHDVSGMNAEKNSSISRQENFVVPVTDSNTDTSTSTAQTAPGLFPELLNKTVRNRTTFFPHPGLLPRPITG